MDIEPDNIEIFYNTEGEYFDATKMTIQLVRPQTFDEVKQQILSNQIIVKVIENRIKELDDLLVKMEDGTRWQVECIIKKKLLQSILNSALPNSKSVVGK